MREKLFSEFAKILLGANGHRWPELGGTLVEPWKMIHTDYVKKDYDQKDQVEKVKEISESCVKKYCRGKTQYPRLVRKFYLEDNGEKRLQGNFEIFINSSTSLRKIRSIQDEVYTWLQEAELPEQEKEQVERFYISHNAVPKEIAVFLAAVMHCVITLS